MTRNLKALGLALMAVFALSAVLAAGAQASPGTIKIDAGAELVHLTGTPTVHNGTERHTLTTFVGTITCETTSFSGTVHNGDHFLTIIPTYDTCTTHPITGNSFTTTIFMEGCDYLFTEGNEDKVDHFEGITMSLECPEGVEGIRIKIYNSSGHGVGHNDGNRRCEYVIPPFKHKANTTAEDTTAASPDDVDLTSEVPNIPYARAFGTPLQCGAVAANATYRGGMTLRAYSDSAHTKQVGLTVTDVG